MASKVRFFTLSTEFSTDLWIYDFFHLYIFSDFCNSPFCINFIFFVNIFTKKEEEKSIKKSIFPLFLSFKNRK